jgi:hypothetical protein
MKNSGKRAIAVLTAIAMFTFSGIALAADGDNTVVNFGYDQNSQFFMWNVTALDHEPYDSEGGEDPMDLDALLEACGLETQDEATSYGFTFDGETILLFELDEEGNFDPTSDEPVDLGDCGALTGGFVAGPAGQVNHGMFMRLFNSMYDGTNRGCLVSLLARSDLGKGDQMVRPGDTDSDAETDEPSSTVEDGNVTFTTLTAQCNGKGADDGDDEVSDSDSGRRGPPQHVLDKFGGEMPGKSGSAGNRP